MFTFVINYFLIKWILRLNLYLNSKDELQLIEKVQTCKNA